MKTSKQIDAILNKKYLKYHYIYLDKSSKDIALEINISRSSIERRLKIYNIQKNNQNIINKIYGRLKVIKYHDYIFKYKQKIHRYLCECACGRDAICNRADLISNHRKTCGECNKRENHHAFKGYKEISASFWGHIKHAAKVRNIPITISIKDIWDLFLKQNRKCKMSNLDLYFDSDNRHNNGNASLDRIDSAKNYTIDNIQWVHKDINLMKNKFDQAYFIQICKTITEYNNV